MRFKRFLIAFSFVLSLFAVFVVRARTATACPFCQATGQTLGQEMAASQAVVIAELVRAAPSMSIPPGEKGGFSPTDPNADNATFRVLETLYGDAELGDSKEVLVPFFGSSQQKRQYLITGLKFDPEGISWNTPIPLSRAGEAYVRKLPSLPESGADRLAFFQDYLEHEDPLLANDAYDEFARAPYEDVIALKDRMDHDKLVDWVWDVETAPSRKRLYLTMLTVCGTPEDLPMLEYMMAPTLDIHRAATQVAAAASLQVHPAIVLSSHQRFFEGYETLKKQVSDALIACYLTLSGPEGMDLVKKLFLSNPKGEFRDTYAAILALRFHGDQAEIIPREDLLSAMRLVLNNPTWADQVIPDLSRWEDWSVMDRLGKMFIEADVKSYLRPYVAAYMIVAAEQPGQVGQDAAAWIDRLEEVDTKAIADAERNIQFGLFPMGSAASKTATAAKETEQSQQVADSGTKTVASQETADEVNSGENDSPASGGPVTTPSDALPEDVASDIEVPVVTEDSEEGSQPFEPEELNRTMEAPETWQILGGSALVVLLFGGCFWVLLRGGGKTS